MISCSQASSRKEGIETAINNCSSMENLKRFTFSTKPEKSGVLIIGDKKNKSHYDEFSNVYKIIDMLISLVCCGI